MKFSKFMSVIIAACALLSACNEKKDGSGKTLTVGVSADYAPFEYFKDGKIVGFDIDLMTEIGKRLNKEVSFKDMSFDAILGSLTTQRLDAAISSIEPTNERRKSIDFSNEYIKSKRVLVCQGTSSIESITDLAGNTIGVQNGSTHETYAKDTLSKDVQVTVKSLAKVPDLLQDMENGNVTCLILGTAEAEAIKTSRPNIKLINLPSEVSGAAVAFPKGSPLKAAVDKILDEMEKDGSLKKLKEKWLPHDVAF
jgi:ABC-type amino acid transport substrate-binding protein